MEVSERKQYKNIQFDPAEIDEIIKFAKYLEGKLGVRFSQRQAVLYAIRQIKKKG